MTAAVAGIMRLTVASLLVSVAAVHAQTTAAAADTVAIAPRSDRPPLAARALARVPGMLATSAWNLAIRAPKAWPRTPRGYGQRFGDQVGFAVVETSVEAGAGFGAARMLLWRREEASCASVVNTRRVAQLAGRLTCSVRQTLTMRTDAGRVRPNVAVAIGILAATVVSLQWRPENDTPQHARMFVLQRTAISYGSRIFWGAVFPPRIDPNAGGAERRSR